MASLKGEGNLLIRIEKTMAKACCLYWYLIDKSNGFLYKIDVQDKVIEDSECNLFYLMIEQHGRKSIEYIIKIFEETKAI